MNKEEAIKIIEEMIKSYKEADKCGLSNNDFKNEIKALEYILSDYKKLQEDFKQVDHECSRLEKKEVELEKENKEWEQAYQLEKDEQFELLQKYRTLKQENEKFQKENEKLKEYIALAPNLDEMTATKYINIQQNSYVQGRAEEQKKYFNLINKIEDKIDRFDYEFKKSKMKNDEDRANYYWDLIRNFKKVLEIEE